MRIMNRLLNLNIRILLLAAAGLLTASGLSLYFARQTPPPGFAAHVSSDGTIRCQVPEGWRAAQVSRWVSATPRAVFLPPSPEPGHDESALLWAYYYAKDGSIFKKPDSYLLAHRQTSKVLSKGPVIEGAVNGHPARSFWTVRALARLNGAKTEDRLVKEVHTLIAAPEGFFVLGCSAGLDETGNSNNALLTGQYARFVRSFQSPLMESGSSLRF